MEEWTNLRPNLAGVSAWTLNGCLKKYDGFKQQLIKEQMVWWPSSGGV